MQIAHDTILLTSVLTVKTRLSALAGSIWVAWQHYLVGAKVTAWALPILILHCLYFAKVSISIMHFKQHINKLRIRLLNRATLNLPDFLLWSIHHTASSSIIAIGCTILKVLQQKTTYQTLG